MKDASSAIAAPDRRAVERNVRSALQEDIGSGDVTAGLIAPDTRAHARVITRENGVLCGQPWVNAVFAALDSTISITWSKQDGQNISAGDVLFTVEGPAAPLLTGERSALNFLQLLSGTATLCQHYAMQVQGTGVKLLDTRKTLPGLRDAQKYAVRCGGCHNHRIGLYDAFLIKENHIAACGGIGPAVQSARRSGAGKMVQVEVESLTELEAALAARADRVMLDNFSVQHISDAVELADGRVELEVSGNVTADSLLAIANTGVDYISIGALTKDVTAMDLSMRLQHTS
ncbi:carboxylating nicotinate-nucleotide diphosphorylase [Candidatus Marimicrobium litorale]|uniref:nicotinate-nucleotide diphosphorylase (carboxylating) n=1 Tax=Candidatus Marimicrobium litorale TaxID=2518991 RepID=A0ABT3T4S6_9GAMM|nr:carboxylating nicotinate-nucleotide diphosphorylase [Candidatus Marimicrobium litorale]MCX2977268.1 carboxylating nicotinate-nucleotide diphosphorylase [Candidatus Marimicrobium litorale]